MEDEKWGEVPCGFVELLDDKKENDLDLIDFCRKNLAGYKVPKKIIYGDVPKTSTGKVQKAKLRESLLRKSD